MAMNVLSDNAKAILLMCGRLGRESNSKPLELRQYNQIARWLRNQALSPAHLLDPSVVPRAAQGAGIPEQRLADLLGRGVQLGFAVESWNRSGIWVICRSDPGYPARLKTHLKDNAPPILYGAGREALLDRGGIAIVGSRNVDGSGEEFTCEVAAWCAREGVPVVSGGARGVDQIAMKSALEAGGDVVGIVADNLLRKSVARDARQAIADGRLVLVSPYHPEAPFLVGTAMGRNKLIYALADNALVISAEHKKGGTWAGAEEELRRASARPVFVRATGDAPGGNRKLLDLGALVFPEQWREGAPGHVLDEAVRSQSRHSGSDHLPLFPTPPTEEEWREISTRENTPTPASSPTGKQPFRGQSPEAADRGPCTIYEAVRPVILAKLEAPMTSEDLAKGLEVGKGQLGTWLKRAVDEKRVKRLTKPVRYVRQDK